MKSIIRIRNNSISREEIKEIIDSYWAWQAMHDARPAYIIYGYDRLSVISNDKLIFPSDIVLPSSIEGIVSKLEGEGIHVIK